MKRRLSAERREREELRLLREIQESCASHPFGCRPPQTPARNRLQKRGDIEHFVASEGKAGHRNRWRLTPQGEERIR